MTDFVQVYADSARGIYIPQHFAESVNRETLSGVSDEDLEILENGPEAESYWDTWESVLDNAQLKDSSGVIWTLWQDSDLFLIHPDHLFDEQRDDLIAAINELTESAVEYETEHEDAGNNYSHMPAESWTEDDDSRLIAQLKDHGIDCKGLDADQLSDIALEIFTMESGHMFSNMESDSIVIAAYPIQEIETQIDYESIDCGIAVNQNHVTQIASDCDSYIGSTNATDCLVYQTTDCVWYAIIEPNAMQCAIDSYIA